MPAGDGPSVAVLPFVNIGGKPEEEYFSDGMTEELLNVLARVPQLKVAARTSVFEFKGRGGNVREIGHKLGVSHIVEGSVRREGAQVRVTAQLVALLTASTSGRRATIASSRACLHYKTTSRGTSSSSS